MRHTDIVVAGGGLAGSLATAMLGRAGHDVVLVDPHPVYPPDFRCEKLDGPQTQVLRKTGIADLVLPATTPDGEAWVARFGRLLEKRPGDQNGILYENLVNTVRAAIPASVPFIADKVSDVTTGQDRQTVTLANGETISARLVVIANGLNIGLRHRLGIAQRELSKCHSVSIGFDFVPVGRQSFPFPALTYYGERPDTRAAYITLFPIGNVMRANLFVYRTMDDPWLRQFRQAPRETLKEIMPRLATITGEYDASGFVKIRPIDLVVTENFSQNGIVLVGDAFATSCPAAGTGAGKALVDVERLCNVHIPRWLETAGMTADKIGSFYADPVKHGYDTFAIEKAFWLKRMTVEPGLPWVARRWARFFARLAAGKLREMRARDSQASPKPAIGRSGLGRPA